MRKQRNHSHRFWTSRQRYDNHQRSAETEFLTWVSRGVTPDRGPEPPGQIRTKPSRIRSGDTPSRPSGRWRWKGRVSRRCAPTRGTRLASARRRAGTCWGSSGEGPAMRWKCSRGSRLRRHHEGHLPLLPQTASCSRPQPDNSITVSIIKVLFGFCKQTSWGPPWLHQESNFQHSEPLRWFIFTGENSVKAAFQLIRMWLSL